MIVGFQGEAGAFSDAAARRLRPGAQTRGYESFDALVAAVDGGAIDAALLPVENSIAGSIARAYDLLWDYRRLHAIAETALPVEMNLIGTPDADEANIREIRSHPVALEQIHRFAGAHPAWKRVAVADTAGAVAEIVALGNPAIAAVGPALAAELYGGRVLRAAIQDDPRNFTRFYLLAREPSPHGSLGCVAIEVENRPGTLRDSDPPTLSDRSSPVPMPRTASDVVSDLHSLIEAAHLQGPYVLVGHSLGGLFIRLYAQTYPAQVRGLVFVDAFAAEIPDLLGSDWPAYRRALDGPLPEFVDSPSFEMVDIDRSVTQVATAPALPPVPAVVLTRTEPFIIPPDLPADRGEKLEQAWRDATTDLVALRPQTPRVEATGSDHFVQVHQPDLVAASVELVIELVQNRRVRRKMPP